MSFLSRWGDSRLARLRTLLVFALVAVMLTGLSACTISLNSSTPTVCDKGISAPVDVKKISRATRSCWSPSRWKVRGHT